MVIAIEPMVNAGEPDVMVLDDGWTAVAERWKHECSFRAHGGGDRNGARILTE